MAFWHHSWYTFHMESQQLQPVIERHIELHTTQAGEQKASIIGTRVNVENIYVRHEVHGKTADEIVSAFSLESLPGACTSVPQYSVIAFTTNRTLFPGRTSHVSNDDLSVGNRCRERCYACDFGR